MARAIGLALTATPLTAAEAVNWGMIWKSYADEELLSAAQQLTSSLSAGPTLALAATKMLMQQAGTRDFDTQLDFEAVTQNSCAKSRDYAEGVQDFFEKREAKYEGR